MSFYSLIMQISCAKIQIFRDTAKKTKCFTPQSQFFSGFARAVQGTC